MTGINELKKNGTEGCVLIDNPKANLSSPFFEPVAQFKNYQGLLSFIRLSPSFVVLNLTAKMGMRPIKIHKSPSNKYHGIGELSVPKRSFLVPTPARQCH